MKALTFPHEAWPRIIAKLSKIIDLEKTARDFGALTRSRKVQKASDLLRLLFCHFVCNLSLRSTSAWAELHEIADISDVAIFKRIKNSLPWLRHLLSSLLNAQIQETPCSFLNRQLFLVDTTYLKMLGTNKGFWYLHTVFHLNSQTIRAPYLTTIGKAETLEYHSIEEGGIYIADRAYARAKQVHYVTQQNADFIVRAGFQTFTLREEDGSKFVLLDKLRSLPKDKPVEFIVWLAKNH